MRKRSVNEQYSGELIVNDLPKDLVSEKIRTLRTNLQFSQVDGNLQTIVVTSASPGEGKSWMSANLAIAFAQAGSKTLIVDADLRKGRQNKVFKLKNTFGLSNLLVDNRRIESRNDNDTRSMSNPFNETKIENLYVITSGTIPPNPTELLESRKMFNFIEELKQQFDVIIFDCPPVNIVADSLILSRLTDTTVLVASYKHTQLKHLQDAKKAIQKVGGKIAGVVLNKMDVKSNKYDYSAYYSYYSKE